MQTGSLAALDALVRDHDSFLHLSHVNPDADGIGSALAMSRWLRALGKRSQVLLPSAVPRRLRFLYRPDEIEIATPAHHGIPGDAVVMLYDVSSLRRFGLLEAPLRACPNPKVVVDHHDDDLEFDALAFVDVDAGATAQVVYEILEAKGVPVTLDLALPLYVALVADTGSFNYGKTSPRTHVIAARLLEAGVKPLEVHGLLEGSRSLDSLRVTGQVMASIEVDGTDPRIAHATLREPALSNGGHEPLDTGDLVNQTISLEGVVAGFLLVQAAHDTTRLSFRSKGDVSVLETAKSFGGGGHVNAAGATVASPLEVVRPLVLERLRESLAGQLGKP